MNDAPQFVKSLLVDKRSYLIDGNDTNEIKVQIEYKDVKSPAVEKLSLWSKGLVEVPKWMVNFQNALKCFYFE